jgi:anti-sigma B factor antagonist
MKTSSMRMASPRLSAQTQVAVLRLVESEYGSNDEARLSRVRQLLMDHAEKPNPTYLIVDLSAVDCFGARFVALLVSSWKQLRKRNGRLALCGMTPFCTELIQILQLHKVFEIYSTQQIAQEEIERNIRSEKEENRTPVEEAGMDLSVLFSRQPDRWFDTGPAPCSQPAGAC